MSKHGQDAGGGTCVASDGFGATTIGRLTLTSSDIAFTIYPEALDQIVISAARCKYATQARAMLVEVETVRGDKTKAAATLNRLESDTDAELAGPWDVLSLALLTRCSGKMIPLLRGSIASKVRNGYRWRKTRGSLRCTRTGALRLG